jgi:hypothetical protein
LKDKTLWDEDIFPRRLDIDITKTLSGRPLSSIDLYLEEQRESSGPVLKPSHIFFPEYLEKGVKEGIELIQTDAEIKLLFSRDIFYDALKSGGLSSCEVRVLEEEGIINENKARAFVMREYAQRILDKTKVW